MYKFLIYKGRLLIVKHTMYERFIKKLKFRQKQISNYSNLKKVL